MSMTFDMAAFQKGMRHKLRLCKQTEAQILNRAGGSVCANAINLTKGANKTQIQSSLGSNGTAFRLLQSTRFQHRLPKKLVGFTRGTHTRAQLNEAARKLITLRKASSRNIAAGFIKPLRVFRPNARRKLSEKGLAAQGKGKRATVASLVASLENHAAGAGKMAFGPLQQAINNEGRFMLSYAPKMLSRKLK